MVRKTRKDSKAKRDGHRERRQEREREMEIEIKRIRNRQKKKVERDSRHEYKERTT